MSYAKINYKDGEPPAINAINLNKMDSGIGDAHDMIASLSSGEDMQGDFTPTGAAEYPVDAIINQSWYIDAVGAGYTFVAGDLATQTAFNMDKIILTSAGWKLINTAASGYTYSKNEIDDKITGSNHIINGAFDVNEYADIDSAPITALNTVYQINRTQSKINGVTATIQRLPKQLVSSTFVYSIKLIATSTASGSIGLKQIVELFYNGETKTFGAWVKSNSVDARLLLNDGVTISSSSTHSGGGAFEFLSFSKELSINATTLEAFVVISSITGGLASITSGDYIETTMMMLESGVVSTAFERLFLDKIESSCKRFLPLRTSGVSTYVGQGHGESATIAFIFIPLSTPARIKPTSIIFSGDFRLSGNGTFHTVSNMSISSISSENIAVIEVTVSTGTIINDVQYRLSHNDINAYIKIEVEL